MRFIFFVSVFLLSAFGTTAFGQVLTSEDSLATGLIRSQRTTVISGYGEARYSVDTKRQSGEANLKRVVLFVGHKFSKTISLFTEMELEDAFVERGSTRGGISMEQAFLKFDLNPTTYVVAGLFIPRIGLINENHLPTTFNGVDRPYLEEQIIPSVWREIGIGVYGQIKRIPGLNYSLGVMNGLNSEKFSRNAGIAGGRQLGQASGAVNLGFTGSLLYYINNFRLQVSSYIGGSTAMTAEQQARGNSTPIELNTGLLANPVILNEANLQYNHRGFSVRSIATLVNVNSAEEINRAYANGVPKTMYGMYGELGYDLLYKKWKGSRVLTLFGRYEFIDLNAQVASNGISDQANTKHYIMGGLTYKPIRGVAIKLDYVQRITGDQNPALIVTPFPQPLVYYKDNGFVNLGIAYNF